MSPMNNQSAVLAFDFRSRKCSPWFLFFLVLQAGCPQPSAPEQIDGDSVSAPNANENQAATEPVSSGWREQMSAVQAGDSVTVLALEPVKSSELAELSSIDHQLEDLLLDEGVADDYAWSDMPTLDALIHLRLRVTQLDDSTIKQLVTRLSKLQILNLPQAQLGSAGIRQLQNLPELRQLRLGGSRIDDAAMAEIAKLANLRSLHLIGPVISPKGLSELAASTKLSSLYIDDCPLADEAWQGLFEAKPGLHVHIDQQHHDRDPQTHQHD